MHSPHSLQYSERLQSSSVPATHLLFFGVHIPLRRQLRVPLQLCDVSATHRLLLTLKRHKPCLEALQPRLQSASDPGLHFPPIRVQWPFSRQSFDALQSPLDLSVQ